MSDEEQQRDEPGLDGGMISDEDEQQKGLGQLWSRLRPPPASGQVSPGWLGLSGARQHPLPLVPGTPRSPHSGRGTGPSPMPGSPSRRGRSPVASLAGGKTSVSLRGATPHPGVGGVFGHIAGASCKRPKMDMMGEAEFAQLETDLREIRDGKTLRANVSGFQERMDRAVENAERAEKNSQEFSAMMEKTVEDYKERTKQKMRERAERTEEMKSAFAEADEAMALSAATNATADALIEELRLEDLRRQQESLPRPSGTSGAPTFVGSSTEDSDVEQLRLLTKNSTGGSFLDPRYGGRAWKPLAEEDLMESVEGAASSPFQSSSTSPSHSQSQAFGGLPQRRPAVGCGIPGLEVDFTLDTEVERQLPVIAGGKNLKVPAEVTEGKTRVHGTLAMGVLSHTENEVLACTTATSGGMLWTDTAAELTKHNNYMVVETKHHKAYKNMVNRGMGEVQHEVVSCVQCQVIGRNRNECSLSTTSREACYGCLKRKIPCSRMLRLSENPEAFGMVFFPVPLEYRLEKIFAEYGYWCRENDDVDLPAPPPKKHVSRGGTIDLTTSSPRKGRSRKSSSEL